ncbi:MAG: hypothetical protein HY664_01480 [Chloroflexi bacterium]|nr:hypothetical protein [Chloroflexota bacterium]
MKELKNAAKIIGIALVTAAVVQELKKPAEQRAWRGHLTFSIPYDFTSPSLQRLKEAYWNAQDDRIITERVFGVGWAINVHALLRKLGWLPQVPRSTTEE